MACSTCGDKRWVVTYPLADGETEPQTEDFKYEYHASQAAAKVPGATYARKPDDEQ